MNEGRARHRRLRNCLPGAAVVLAAASLAAGQAFEKANPSIKIKIVTYDGDANGSNSFRTKMDLFNRAGSGWPDVVFTADDNSASWGSMSGTGNLAPLNKGVRPAATTGR